VADVIQEHIHRSIQDDRIRRIRARAIQAQRQEAAREWIAAQRPAPRSIRRSIGRSIVRVGEVIASEHQPVASS
jgi:hypothetical protein